MLEETVLKGKNRERIEVVLKSGKRLMNLINDILDLSKIEAGKMELREENVLLEELIKEVELSISPLFINKKIDLRIIRDTNTSIVLNTDRGKVTQVLINLLGNAVKFTESGHVDLNISLANGNLIFKVTDTGIGISSEDQKVIFEEFRQVDGTITKKYSGTGLGLTICKKISNLLNGSINVSSMPGNGSVFTFAIPFNFVEKIESKEDINLNVTKLIENRKNLILIIDDDADVRYTIGQYLISRGYDVIYSGNGEQGIKEAVNQQPFIIILDVLMHQTDGWDILINLKNTAATWDIPVILISILGDKNLGYGFGAFEYIVKPFSAEQLLSAFSRLESSAKKIIEKIVLVDDDELEFEKFRSELRNEKIRIDFIQDSELAFNRILEIQPDLIIIDLIMPKVDGITLTYKLKANKETKHIPIIVSIAWNITDKEKTALNNIIEIITLKSKGHPLDVLKIVRDRIKMHELFTVPENNKIEIQESYSAGHNIPSQDLQNNYIGEILVVDDDPDTLFTINEILESCNCKTHLVKGGKECLRLLEHITPDIILLDIMMPEMDGFQTINQIKLHPRLANIPVFAVTAKAMLDDKEVILRNGFDDYIPKPINAGVLSIKIKKVLSNSNVN
jgi:CheY-like chemotaxis protein/two-component sensor histidine kinase